MSTVIVIPAFNEEHRLQANTFAEWVQTHDVLLLFVDDGSTDGTHAMLKELSKEHPERMTVLRLERNGGKAEAVRQGMRWACEHNAEFTGYWDADLATPLDTIPSFEKILRTNSNIDIVTGARVALLGRSIQRKATRHYIGRIFATAIALWLHMPVYDTQCGAKLFRITPTFEAILEKPFSTRWIFDVEILKRMGLQSPDNPLAERIYEFPLEQWHDIGGSKMKLSDFLRAPWEFLRLTWIYREKWGRHESAPQKNHQ